ncbi:MAG: transcriptional regulator [Methylobacterium sp.]|nr:MAG: transcriptional regulator [Methylobacterium sp.]
MDDPRNRNCLDKLGDETLLSSQPLWCGMARMTQPWHDPSDDDADRAISSQPEQALPLNERIARVLGDGIAQGDYPVGTLLPTEAALCDTYGASRFTVREALRKLVEAGLIERRRGAGSRVVATTPKSKFSQTFHDLTEIFQYAQDTHLDVAQLGMVRIDEGEAQLVGASPGTRWLRLNGLRWNAERSTSLSHVTAYIHARFAPLLEDVRTARGAIYALIEARSGEAIEEAVQEIAALPMPASVARMLGLRAGLPAMRLVRRYLDASGGTMMTSINWHPGEHFTYTMRLRRGEWKA